MQILHSTSFKKMALEISASIDIPIAEIKIHKFLSGEYICKIDKVLTANAIVVGSIKTNDDLMEILSIIDAAKRAGASDITLVAPYIAYGRQDVMQAPFSSVGIEIIAKILNSTEITNLITVDIHSVDSLKFFNMNVHHITTIEILDHYKDTLLEDITIIAPDKGSLKRLEKLGVDTIFLDKKRVGGNVLMELRGNVEGKCCLIIDDIFDSGSTMMAAVDILKANGAQDIKGYVTHFLGNSASLPLYITNSIDPIISAKNFLKTLSLVPLIYKILLPKQ